MQVILDGYIKFNPLVYRETIFKLFILESTENQLLLLFIVLLMVAGFHRVLQHKL